MSERLLRVLQQLCEAAAWCFATGDRTNGLYFLNSATRAVAVTDGAECIFG